MDIRHSEPPLALASLRERVASECRLGVLFMRSDPWTTLFPGATVTMAALLHLRPSIGRGAGLLALGLLQIWLLVYALLVSEQSRSWAEDRLNKPWRPLAAGLVTHEGMQWRCIGLWLASLGLTALLGTVAWCLALLALSLLHARLGGARWWPVKSIVPPAGLLCLLALQWQAVMPLTAEVWRWFAGMFVLAAATIAVQDLRDVEGDAASGRRTLPMVFGNRRVRRGLALVFLLVPVAEVALMRLDATTRWETVACYATSVLLCLILAWRVLHRSGRVQDHRTYRYWEYWYAAMAVSMGFCV